MLSSMMRLGIEHQQLQKVFEEETHDWNFYKVGGCANEKSRMAPVRLCSPDLKA